jgi:uncharacterized protein YraI
MYPSSTRPSVPDGRQRSDRPAGLSGRLAALLLGLLALVGSLTLTSAPAYAAGSGTVSTGGNYSLNVRSGPNTASSIVRSLPNGSSVTLDCWVTGQAVNGRWGVTSLWHRAAGGYISDGFVYTGTNGPARGEPACTSAPAPSSTKAGRALAWARSQLGATGWNGWCDRFVAVAYGRSSSGYTTAYNHYLDLNRRGLIHRTGTPPAGALVFYGATAGNGYAGHVQLSEGNGSYITTAATVRRVSLTWPGAPYLGWSYANPEWPGR